MTQHTYDNESVQELLNWAKKMLETKNYPTEKYELNKCTTIINGKTYLESLVAMIGRNWEYRSIQLPYVDSDKMRGSVFT